tara:strand:- start:45 stop:998 length:954 start_codon:yes stop_codon:yes gene_type:complete
METKTKIRTQRKAPSQVANTTNPILSDSDWRDNAKVLKAFPDFRDKWISEFIKTPLDRLDDQPAHNSQISQPMLKVSLRELVEHWIARDIRQEHWDNHGKSGMADFDDDIIGDGLHFLLHDCFFKSELHLNQAVKVLDGIVSSWWASAKIKCWDGASFRSAAEHCDYLRGAVGNLEEIQGRYFERQRDKHSKREDKFNGTKEMVEWCNKNGFNLDSLGSDDCGILSMLFEFRDLVKGVSEEDYDDIIDETEESYGDILEACGELCESSESIFFRRRVIEETQELHIYASDETYESAVSRLRVIEEYQTFSKINKDAP